MKKDIGGKFEGLVAVMRRLRAPGGCPWDREQTFRDIAAHTVEEAHEVADAVERGNYDELREELGDLLLQVVFHSRIAEDEGRFAIGDVIDSITEKLIRRHPHVFGDESVDGSRQVVENWEEIKRGEGKSLLGGVPKTLPALLMAYRMGQKASRVGFDWPDGDGVLDKVGEEAAELCRALGRLDAAEIRREYGDLLFALANLGRFIGCEPEGALREASNRFKGRFERMEGWLKDDGKDMRGLRPGEWDELWKRAKDEE